jgi:hypothetical protein
MQILHPRLQKVRDIILAHLSTCDGTHATIGEATGQCASSVFAVLADLHAERLIHISGYQKRSSRHRAVRTYRMGPGVDATLGGTDIEEAMAANANSVLELLNAGDLTREQITAALSWSTSTTWNVVRYMRENKLMHVVAKINGPLGQANVHLYRAGAGVDYVVAPNRKSSAKPKKRKPQPPPATDPLMAALFGR